MARKQHTNSIDGFTVRRRGSDRPIGQASEPLPKRFLRNTPIENSPTLPRPVDQSSRKALRRSDIDESLQQFNEQPKKKRRFRLSKRFFGI